MGDPPRGDRWIRKLEISCTYSTQPVPASPVIRSDGLTFNAPIDT